MFITFKGDFVIVSLATDESPPIEYALVCSDEIFAFDSGVVSLPDYINLVRARVLAALSNALTI